MKPPKIMSKIPKGQQIVLMQSDSNYTILYLDNGQKILSGYTLKYYEKISDSQCFMRPNRSEIINMSFVKRINLDDFSLLLYNGRSVHISRRRMKIFESWN